MDKIQNINVQRIRWCCDFSRITTETLAQNVGIAGTTMEKFLEGEDSLTYNQLKKIADYFSRGILFFLDDSPLRSTDALSTAFRTISNERIDLDNKMKALIERAERQRDVYAAMIEDLEESPQYVRPDVSSNPSTAALQVREWLGLGEHNNFASYRAAVEEKGILVFLTNGFQGKWQIPKLNPILGFSLYDDKLPLIVVKKTEQEARQAFTLMHELAHIILHRTSIVDDESDLSSHEGLERAANQFAAHLLLPNGLLSQISLNVKPDDPSEFDNWLSAYRRQWGISTEVILIQLMASRLVSRTEYEGYKSWMQRQPHDRPSEGVRLYRHREPRNIFGDRYVRSVLDALDQDRITINKASKFLDGLQLKDIRKLEAYCATR